MVLKNGLPQAALDDDHFMRRTLEVLDELPAERVRELRARHRRGILAETAEREARMRERRGREGLAKPTFAQKTFKALMALMVPRRTNVSVRLISATAFVLLLALAIGRGTPSSTIGYQAQAGAAGSEPSRHRDGRLLQVPLAWVRRRAARPSRIAEAVTAKLARPHPG